MDLFFILGRTHQNMFPFIYQIVIQNHFLKMAFPHLLLKDTPGAWSSWAPRGYRHLCVGKCWLVSETSVDLGVGLPDKGYFRF